MPLIRLRVLRESVKLRTTYSMCKCTSKRLYIQYEGIQHEYKESNNEKKATVENENRKAII